MLRHVPVSARRSTRAAPRAAAEDQRLGSPSPPSDGLPEFDGELLTGGAATGFGDVVFAGVDAFGLLTGARCAAGGGGGGVTARCVGAEERLLLGAGLFDTLATWLEDADGGDERRALLVALRFAAGL